MDKTMTFTLEELRDIRTALQAIEEDFKHDGGSQAEPERYRAIINRITQELKQEPAKWKPADCIKYKCGPNGHNCLPF